MQNQRELKLKDINESSVSRIETQKLVIHKILTSLSEKFEKSPIKKLTRLAESFRTNRTNIRFSSGVPSQVCL